MALAVAAAAVHASAYLMAVYGLPVLSLVAMCSLPAGSVFWSWPVLHNAGLVLLEALFWGDMGQTAFTNGNLARYVNPFVFILCLAGGCGAANRQAANATLQWMRGVPFHGADMSRLGNCLLAVSILFFGWHRYVAKRRATAAHRYVALPL